MADLSQESFPIFDWTSLARIFEEIIRHERPVLFDSEIEEAARFLNSGIIQDRLEKAKERHLERSNSRYRSYSDDELAVRSSEDDLENRREYSEESDLSRETSEDHASIGNIPRVSFGSFVSDQEMFLMANRKSFPLLEDVEIDELNYPLGVVFDEETKVWMICDRNAHKIMRIDVEKFTVRSIEDVRLRNPSAITVLEDGRSVAILCSNLPHSEYSIFIYKLEVKYIEKYATYLRTNFDMRFPLRGLARSFASNLLSLDSLPNGERRLRVFNREGGAAFPLPGASMPSFIASRGERVAVSDLGTNQVYLLQVNDEDFFDIECFVLKIISTEYSPPDIICNQAGFLFAAGLQFDAEGNILIGDAKGHSLKLYDNDLNFLHRVSSDFPLPYMSSFFINSSGEMIILDLHSPRKYTFATISSVSDVQDWIEPIRPPIYNSPRGRGSSYRRIRR